ncbi:MAG: RNB domain-containing ribonuclease [Proteobacteria bacterium]|nr:RNB domain-containing ribonuclease [Pseudomonadota bacterium]
MKPGTLVEYIDQQKITCAVVLELKNNRLRLLNESDHELNQSTSRISFFSDDSLPMDKGRDVLLTALKQTALLRRELTQSLDLKSLWELLNGEMEWIDLDTMTEYCFPTPVSSHQKSAVIRALFENRLYFKFDHNRFFPHTMEQVEKILAQEDEEKSRKCFIEDSGNWFKEAINSPKPCLPENLAELGEILKSLYVFDKDSRHYSMGKDILAQAGISSRSAIFRVLVKLGIFEEEENIDLLRMEIPRSFSEDVLAKAQSILQNPVASQSTDHQEYSHVQVITIDGQSTTDYDDALSLERIGDAFILGIHISDVAHFVKRDDLIDKRAFNRGSSIYMADSKIPMLPPDISENAASLIGGEYRPCISVLVTLNRFFEIKDFDVTATRIKVDRQLTYSEASSMAESDPDMAVLVKIARAFREKRLSSGATHITLPEINLFLGENNEILISRIDRESPSRMMVAEMMIMGNWLMASFLSRNSLPAIFRSQNEPKDRLYKGESDSLFLNCLQRKFVNRAIISHKAGFHAGLGLDAYVTATSPIRRYHDLVTQRQIKGALGIETPYTVNEITQISQMLEVPIANVGKIQFNRRKYWLLKYLEKRIGEKTPGLVLDKKRNSYTVVLTDYMLEYNLPASGLKLKPQDSITLVIQNANAQKASLSVFMTY